MQKASKTIGTLFIQIALGLLFIVGGIWTLQGSRGDEISTALNYIFSKDIAHFLCIIYGIIEIVAGVFLILRLFLNINTKFDSILMIIIMLLWLVAIVCIDFLGANSIFKSFNNDFLPFLNRFARHLLILGAIINVKNI